MASFTSRRLAHSLSLSFNFTTRARTYGFIFTQTQRTRRRGEPSPLSHNHSQQYARAFSSQPSRHVEAPAAGATSSSTPNPSTSAPRPPYRPTAQSSPAQQAAASNAPPSRNRFQKSHEPPLPTERNAAASSSLANEPPLRELNKGLSDAPPNPTTPTEVDWTTSYHGLSNEAFSKEAQAILLKPVNEDDIEIKTDGILYLPEIKYRRILNQAFGPGAWGLAPRGETIITAKSVTREYALLVHGRYVEDHSTPIIHLILTIALQTRLRRPR